MELRSFLENRFLEVTEILIRPKVIGMRLFDGLFDFFYNRNMK